MVASIYGNQLESEKASDRLIDDSTLPLQNKCARNCIKKLGMKNGSLTGIISLPHLKESKRTSGKGVNQSLWKRISVGSVPLRSNVIHWISKKQNYVVLYNVEAELTTADSNCSRVVWMKQTQIEYNVIQDVMTLYCDIVTKALKASQFKTLMDKLGICHYEEL